MDVDLPVIGSKFARSACQHANVSVYVVALRRNPR